MQFLQPSPICLTSWVMLLNDSACLAPAGQGMAAVPHRIAVFSVHGCRYTTPAEEGVYIHGLYLEGCRWDPLKRVLAESQPKVQLRNLPVLLVASYAQWN